MRMVVGRDALKQPKMRGERESTFRAIYLNQAQAAAIHRYPCRETYSRFYSFRKPEHLPLTPFIVRCFSACILEEVGSHSFLDSWRSTTILLQMFEKVADKHALAIFAAYTIQ